MNSVVRITKWQLVMRLKQVNKLLAFYTFINGLAPDDDVKIEWEYKDLVERDGLLVAAIQQETGYTDQQVDQFFEAAGHIDDGS